MSTIISIANQKGGVGKTTCTVNFGHAIADAGKRCLFIDIDPQNNLGKALAPELVSSDDYATSKANAYTIFESETKAEPYQVSDNVFIIGGDKRLGGITQAHILNFADSLDLIKDDYDYILIDCPPSANTLQHASLMISDRLLVVTQAEKMSVDGVTEIAKTSRQIRRMNPDLELLGVVINLAERQATNDQKEFETELRKEYGNLVFENKLLRTVRVREAMNKGKSLQQANKNDAIKFGFSDVTKELMQRLEK